MREASIEETACRKALDELSVRSLKLNGSGNTGWPDRVFFIPGGKPLFIEFKQPGESAEPRQALIHKFLKYHGYQITVEDSVEGALKAVRTSLATAVAAGRAQRAHSP